MKLSRAYHVSTLVFVYYVSGQIINWNTNIVKMYFSSKFVNRT